MNGKMNDGLRSYVAREYRLLQARSSPQPKVGLVSLLKGAALRQRDTTRIGKRTTPILVQLFFSKF